MSPYAAEMNAFTLGVIVFLLLLGIGIAVTAFRRTRTRHDDARHQAVTDEALYRHGPPSVPPGGPGGS